MKVVPYRIGEPVCSYESSDPEGPFCFIYSTVFERLTLHLPYTDFERALLTEVNVVAAQLHPNNWAFVRAFSILCDHFGRTPSMDVFLYFFEAKSPGKKLWVSFNGVVGRVLLILFQKSYKGFKGKFFKIRCSKFDPTLLVGFPLYRVKEPGLKKPKCLEDLPCGNERCATSSPTFERCLALSSYSSSNTALILLRATLVPHFSLIPASVFLACVHRLFEFLCSFIFLCRHGT